MSWKTGILGDVITLKRGYDLPHDKRVDGDSPVVSSSGITGHHNEAKIKAPAVVTGRYGTLGEVFYVDKDCWPLNTALYVKDFKGSRPKYIYYFLKTILKGIQSDKAAVPGVNRNDLHARKVVFADSDALQKKIEDLLGPYDELVDNNRRRIELLEKSTKLLYSEWFVHHRFPGHEHLKVIDGVPQGWCTSEVGDYIEVEHGFAFKGEYFSEEATSRILLTPGNFKIGGGIKLDKFKYYSEDAPLDNRYVLDPGTILLTMTDLSKVSDTLGLPLIVPSIARFEFLHNQRLGKMVFKGDGYFPKYFFYHLFQDYRYRSYIVGSATGTAVKHTSPGRICAFRALLPAVLDCEIIKQFDEIAGACLSEIELLQNQNMVLESTRDLLLPRLMNGDITV